MQTAAHINQIDIVTVNNFKFFYQLTRLQNLIIMFIALLFAWLSLSDSYVLKKVLNRYSSLLGQTLNTGDFENAVFEKLDDPAVTFSSDGNSFSIGKYSLQATIKSKDFNDYLQEYKAEMKRKKVIFPGFRPGSLPPYVMPDIRKYLVSYGLETLIGQLCNLNSIEVT